MDLLSKKEVKQISGDENDVSKSLDADRSWLSVICVNCSTPAFLARPEPGTNTVVEKSIVEVTLPDGSTTSVELPQEVDSDKLLWVCDACGTRQEANISSKGSK